MKLNRLFQEKKTVYSFELFPPKPDSPIEKIYDTLGTLKDLSPDYVSITYGAGGSGLSRTVELATLVKGKYGLEPLAHFTGIHSTKEDVLKYLGALVENGIENVLALRGDKNPNLPQPKEFNHATDLVRFIQLHSDLNIVGAGYPEGHFESPNRVEDVRRLKEKVDAGVSHINTQLFFDNEDFYSFMDLCRAANINVPIQAGIMPIVRKSQIERIVTLTGAKVPKNLSRIFARYADSPEALKDAGIAYATQQIVDLISYGVDGIHLYIMNNAEVAKAITLNVRSLLR